MIHDDRECAICKGEIEGILKDGEVCKIQEVVAPDQVATVYEVRGEGKERRSHEITIPPEGLSVAENHFVYHKNCIDSWINSRLRLTPPTPPKDPNTNAVIVMPILPLHDGTNFIHLDSTHEEVKEFRFSAGVTKINTYSFFGCFGLTTVVIPDGVESIGNNAFLACVNMTSVTFPKSLKQIDEFAFRNCYKLTNVDLSETNITTESLSPSAFDGCKFLQVGTTLTLPEGVTYGT